MRKRYCLIQKCCFSRSDEIVRIKKFFAQNKWRATDSPKNADVAIVFACAFSNMAAKDSVSYVRELKEKITNKTQLIVGGCLPKIDKFSLEDAFSGMVISPENLSPLNKMPGIRIKIEDVVLVPDDKIRFYSWVSKFYRNAPQWRSRKNANKKSSFFKTLAALRKKIEVKIKKMLNIQTYPLFKIIVSTGCVKGCSFCAVKFAIGAIKSKPMRDVIEEAQKALKAGYKMIALCGDDVGGYGTDIGVNFGVLLKELSLLNADFKLVITYLHPSDFLKHFDEIEALSSQKKLHSVLMPVQSGSVKILKLMNRNYDIELLKNKVLSLRLRGVAINTSIIIGFPGETNEDFDDTIKFLSESKVNFTTVHFYTDMPKIKSASLQGKISFDIMKQRYNRLKNTDVDFDQLSAERELSKMLQEVDVFFS